MTATGMTATGNGTPPRGRAVTVGRGCVVVVWLVTLGYAGLVLLRYVAYDSNRYVAELNAETLWLFLPAYALASAAWCFRRFGLAFFATIAVAFHVITVGASIGGAEPIPAEARAAPHLRVLSANVRFSNPTKARLAAELMRVDADVVLLQEVTSGWLRILELAGFDARYRYRIAEPHEDSRGMAVYSRVPLTNQLVVEPDGVPTIAARVTVRGRPVSLVNVHAGGPTEGMPFHRATVAVVRELVRTRPAPRVVAGDFNATPYNRTMHLMSQLGLESAHVRRGRGLAVTWPNGKHPLPPVRIDHVLVDPDVVVLDVRELRGSGSDHKPVLADLAIL
jgi:endonuclease/exonuclease/phosphatase (EEP) superfamily protein YafD